MVDIDKTRLIEELGRTETVKDVQGPLTTHGNNGTTIPACAS